MCALLREDVTVVECSKCGERQAVRETCVKCETKFGQVLFFPIFYSSLPLLSFFIFILPLFFSLISDLPTTFFYRGFFFVLAFNAYLSSSLLSYSLTFIHSYFCILILLVLNLQLLITIFYCLSFDSIFCLLPPSFPFISLLILLLFLPFLLSFSRSFSFLLFPHYFFSFLLVPSPF